MVVGEDVSFLIDDETRPHTGPRFFFTVPKKLVIKILKRILPSRSPGISRGPGRTHLSFYFGADIDDRRVLFLGNFNKDIASQRLALGTDRVSLLNKKTAAITPEKRQGENQYGHHYSKKQNFRRIESHRSSSAN